MKHDTLEILNLVEDIKNLETEMKKTGVMRRERRLLNKTYKIKKNRLNKLLKFKII